MFDTFGKDYLGPIAAVFKVENKQNGKIYIGCVHDIYDANFRKVKHRQKELLNDVNRIGEAQFDFEILVRCKPTEVYKWRQKYIDEYDSVARGYNNLNYNTHRPVIVISCFDLDDYEYYDSALDVARALNVKVESVMDVIYGQKETIKNKIIRLTNDGSVKDNGIDISRVISARRKNAALIDGQWMPLIEISKRYCVNVNTIRRRLNKGMSIEDAVKR